MERRKFLESTCKACLMAGAGFLISDLSACSPSTAVIQLPVSENTVRLPMSSFVKDPLAVVRPQGWLYDIAVRKTAEGPYEALLLECTHQRNQLLVTPSGFKCTLHGSQFNLDGQVVKGPAESALKKFSTHQEQDFLVIQLKS